MGNIQGKIKKTKTSDKNLTKKHFSDAGLDICSAEKTVVPAGARKLISTDLYITVPHGHVGIIKPRSGLAVKNGIDVGAGVIDHSYNGEVRVLLFNHSDKSFAIEPGDRIAQLLTIPVNLNFYKPIEKLDETERSDGGFGSTGK